MSITLERLKNGARADVGLALTSLRPGAQWNLDGDAYAGLTWLDKEQSQPSEAEVTAEVERLKGVSETLRYFRDRAGKYAPVADQLDMIYWDKVNGTSKWADHVAEVKKEFPKQ